MELILRFGFHMGYPYDYPAVPPFALFGDFRFVAHKLDAFHSRAFFSAPPVLPYPAPTAALYKLFMPVHFVHLHVPTAIYILTILAVSLVMLGRLHKALVRRGVRPPSSAAFLTGMYLLSFPFWFEVHQGNIEWAVWAVLSLGIAAHWQRRGNIAAVCFGVAGAMKLFPFIFLGLLLARKQYRQIALAIVASVVTTLLGLWLICPDIAYSWQQTSQAVNALQSIYMLSLRPIESGFDHSLFVLLKRSFPVLPPPERLRHILNLYLAACVIGGCALYFLRIRKLPVVNQVLCLTIASILLPPVSYDYTLIHLYAPFVLLVFYAFAHLQQRSGPLTAAFTLFAFVLSAQSEFIWHGLRVAGQLKAVGLLALFIVALIYPFNDTYLAASSETPLEGSSL